MSVQTTSSKTPQANLRQTLAEHRTRTISDVWLEMRAHRSATLDESKALILPNYFSIKDKQTLKTKDTGRKYL